MVAFAVLRIRRDTLSSLGGIFNSPVDCHFCQQVQKN